MGGSVVLKKTEQSLIHVGRSAEYGLSPRRPQNHFTTKVATGWVEKKNHTALG